MMTQEPRETSSTTISLLLGHVRAHGGDAAVADVLARAGITESLDWLEDTATWVSYDTRIRLFTAATTVLDDPHTMYQVGATVVSDGLHPVLVQAPERLRVARSGVSPAAAIDSEVHDHIDDGVRFRGADVGTPPLPVARGLSTVAPGLPVRPGPVRGAAVHVRAHGRDRGSP
ncbi:hypothetical protein KIV56_10755 [Cryobacterium breve]|uniref:DUF222 domain-containing protein n=1 Tax=Cryobacterium breve TaxID=1259258 RepID=A0ABY7N942_9MICO|nr:hypothetical protein [Cryobacterium breve]WBM79022.1 hypothetical protein KIV56_10755 [Cryobacterium breve]